MPDANDQQAKALTAIAIYMKQLVPVMESMRDALVDFGKMLKTPEKVEVATTDLSAIKQAATHTDAAPPGYVQPEGYAAGAPKKVWTPLPRPGDPKAGE